MADEQDKWLNRETADRLLRGEPLEAVDASARDQAERLSRVLGALSAEAAPATGELPGEQAALAAFRKAREAADAERSAVAHADGAPALPRPGADSGLVRIGAPARTGIPARRPRWARPVRLALAAALTVGTLGGVAMAAGTGMLPTPFGPAHPASSVSAGAPSDGPPASVSPEGSHGPTPSPGTPSGGAGTRRGGASGEATGPDNPPGKNASPGAGDPSGTPGSRWKDAAAACQDMRDGKSLDAGRRRALENLAGGSARVSRFCKVVLTAVGSVDGQGNGGQGDENGGNGGNGKGKGGKGKGDGNENGQGGDGGHFGDGGGKGTSVGGTGWFGGIPPLPPLSSAVAPAHSLPATGTPLVPAPGPTDTAL
ncbi:hypothetical protein ABT072_13425 [Streptomyces sp. NPDC002589]|uniref:hypothetical protein n=1 Tax=Streptomyces sp. NPDC002589 TaxID=3154420 RepID=UPI00333320DC